MLRNVALSGSKILRVRCPERTLEEIVVFLLENHEASLSDTLDKMADVMRLANGMGLAANQVGLPLRLFILKSDTRGYKEYINPAIISQEELVTFEGEGCLSIPGATARTKRFRKLKLRWQDRVGTFHEGEFEGVEAFAVQHEVDHLEGRLYIDQLGSTERRLTLNKHKKFLRNLRR
jgi:peptide deformylase